jgi:hypothetical protein|nr:MAG TPA: hypothetical protein [Bacteriophage sp.]
MTHSKVDLIDYIGKLLSSNDDVTKTHDRVVVELQQVVSEKYHDVDYDYRSDIHITYEKREVSDGKRQYAYVPTIVRYDGGSIQAFDDTPKTGDFIDWFNEGYKKAMCLYFPWFEKLKLRDLDIETIHALCGNDEADADIYRQYGLAIAIDPSSIYDHGFVFKYDHEHEYAPGTVMIERSRLGWNADTLKAMVKSLTGRADEFELKPSYTFVVGEINDNVIGDMAKQLMVNGTYDLLAGILYPAVNQPDSDVLDIEVKLQHVVAKGLRPKYYRLKYNGHLLNKTSVPYAVGLREILNDNHTSFKEVDSLPLLPVFTGEGDDLRILYYKVDIMVYKADAVKDSSVLTPHEHSDTAEGHSHGTSAPE